MIEGGFILQPRIIEESWVANSAPVVREVWFYLLRKANYKDKKYNGFIIKRGQCFLSYSEIRAALSWKVGFRIERYSESQMKRGMKLLRREGMIDIVSNPRGNVITICKYNYYQDPKNYERTNERTNERTTTVPTAYQERLPINKEGKELKKKELKPIVEQTSLDCISSVIDHLNKKTGKKYRAGSKSSRMHILARTKEGHTLDDFIAAIDNQAGAWMGTEWEKYLRPSTLFNSEKFEGYVNNTGKKAKVKRTREDLIREYGSA
jgi:uncharacterized phage protein (TIGR02220 family)